MDYKRKITKDPIYFIVESVEENNILQFDKHTPLQITDGVNLIGGCSKKTVAQVERMNKKKLRKVSRCWTHEETEALLQCYSQRKHEFDILRKKRFAYIKICEDLRSLNILLSPISTEEVENKMKSLIKAYRTNIDNNNKTGSGTSIEVYAEIMEEIFSDSICRTSNTTHRFKKLSPKNKESTSVYFKEDSISIKTESNSRSRSSSPISRNSSLSNVKEALPQVIKTPVIQTPTISFENVLLPNIIPPPSYPMGTIYSSCDFRRSIEIQENAFRSQQEFQNNVISLLNKILEKINK